MSWHSAIPASELSFGQAVEVLHAELERAPELAEEFEIVGVHEVSA